ncbi:MAG: A/G-specific adenine glycosylase [Actinomycetales bacterium]
MSDPTQLHPRVLAWYADAARDLPWRTPGTSPWGVLVSEVMSQQTPVARVVPYWQEWMRTWPTPADLAAAAPADVVRAWGRLGYPRRALRLRESAQAILDRHDGDVPADALALRALPGIGEYTAAAVAVFAFGQRHSVVDVNVRRVLARALGGTAEPAPSLTASERALAEVALPADPPTAATWSVAVMELGALVCTARTPDCPGCPLLDVCAWQKNGRPAHTGPARRTQAWDGTDRQARGRILALLREASVADQAMLTSAWPHDDIQLRRAIDSLVADGLAECAPDGLCLPGTAADVRQIGPDATTSTTRHPVRP